MSNKLNYEAQIAIQNIKKYKNILISNNPIDMSTIDQLGLDILKKKYCSQNHGENTIEECFARVALAFSDDYDMAEKIYKLMGNLWFIPATPIMSNGGLLDRGIPISCYLNESGTTVEEKIMNINENIHIANNWGGIGTLLDGLHTKDVLVYCKMLESLNFAFYNDDRKSSSAVYLSINHGAIEEFLEIRKPTGGDARLKCLNLHHGIIIPDAFFESLKNKEPWGLYENNGQFIKNIDPLMLWNKVIKMRYETGEPYLLFSDRLKEATPDFHTQQNMAPKTSNLCSEITLHTSAERTAVCCLGSLNLNYYDQWKDDDTIVEISLRFLDNVLNYTKTFFNHLLPRAAYSIDMENAVGLGVMGFHSFLQNKEIPIDSDEAHRLNEEIFFNLKQKSIKVSKLLALERGACKDAQAVGVHDARFSYMLAIAPTATISNVGGCSPGIEPYISNIMTIKNGMGNYNYLNKGLLKHLNSHQLFSQDPSFQDKIIKSITQHNGSVQHLDFLSENIKNCYKTAFEIDQMTLVNLAATRQKYICQAQSLNLFFGPENTIASVSKIIVNGYKQKIKTFYYSRTTSIVRAENTTEKINLNEINSKYQQNLDGDKTTVDLNNFNNDYSNNDIICEGCI